MLKFERITDDLDAWQAILETYPDRRIFQTPAWIRFLAASQQARHVAAVLRDGDQVLGHFCGLVKREGLLRVLGSPFPGWTTSYMGIRLRPEADKRAALQAVGEFAFHDLGCQHLELCNSWLTPDDIVDLGFKHRDWLTYEIDLDRPEEEILAAMSPACRRCIRKAAREGVVIEEANDGAFADEYFAQLKDVFAKQGLTPTYSVRRVRQLLRHVFPAGMLLLLRARDPTGRCIATGIFPAYHRHMYFWGGASWRDGQILRPNEAIQWYAMRYWKSRGIRTYDMVGGGGEYKKKYGGTLIRLLAVRKSKYRWVALAREVAFRAYRACRRVESLLVKRPHHEEREEA
jgi:hypothetical protein